MTPTATDTAGTLGTGATIALVCFVILAGAFTLLPLLGEWWKSRTAAATFTDDFIPEAADVAAIDRALPQFGDTHQGVSA